jgi:hypothetical protein
MRLPSDKRMSAYATGGTTESFLKKYISPLTPLLISILPIYFFSQEDYMKVNWNQYITMFVGIIVPLLIADICSFNLDILLRTNNINCVLTNIEIYNSIIKNVEDGTIKTGASNWILQVYYKDEFGNFSLYPTPNIVIKAVMNHNQVCRFTFQEKEYAFLKGDKEMFYLFSSTHSDAIGLIQYLSEKSKPVLESDQIRVATTKNIKGYGPDEIVYEHKVLRPSLLVSEENEQCIQRAVRQFMDPCRRAKLAQLGCKNKLTMLLYGPPGTGKSSIALHIAGILNRNIFYVNKRDPDKFFKEHARLIDFQNTVIVFDDVDFLNMKERKEVTTKTGEIKANVNLIALMEMLDGNCISDDAVMIFTTNHENDFDPALFRPGRITNKFHISKMTPSIWTKLIFNVYGVKNFETMISRDIDLAMTLSEAVNKHIMPNIDDFEGFHSSLLASSNSQPC